MSMSQLEAFLMDIAFSGWMIMGAFVIGFLLGRSSGLVRGLLLFFLLIAPNLLVILSARLDHCWDADRCMVGFGMILAVIPGVLWAIAAGAGMGVRYVAAKR